MKYAIYQLNIGGMFSSPVYEIQFYYEKDNFGFPLISYRSKNFEPNMMFLFEFGFNTFEEAEKRVKELENEK